jgi:hypothetical protein
MEAAEWCTDQSTAAKSGQARRKKKKKTAGKE